MKRGLRASSSSAVRSSLIAVLNTESVTNWWPQTSSSKAFVVSRDPGCRARAHRTANGVGASVTAVPSRSKRAFASSSSNRSKRTRTGFELAEDRAWSVRLAISIRTGPGLSRDDSAVNSPYRAAASLVRRHAGGMIVYAQIATLAAPAWGPSLAKDYVRTWVLFSRVSLRDPCAPLLSVQWPIWAAESKKHRKNKMLVVDYLATKGRRRRARVRRNCKPE